MEKKVVTLRVVLHLGACKDMVCAGLERSMNNDLSNELLTLFSLKIEVSFIIA